MASPNSTILTRLTVYCFLLRYFCVEYCGARAPMSDEFVSLHASNSGTTPFLCMPVAVMDRSFSGGVVISSIQYFRFVNDVMFYGPYGGRTPRLNESYRARRAEGGVQLSVASLSVGLIL